MLCKIHSYCIVDHICQNIPTVKSMLFSQRSDLPGKRLDSL